MTRQCEFKVLYRLDSKKLARNTKLHGYLSETVGPNALRSSGQSIWPSSDLSTIQRPKNSVFQFDRCQENQYIYVKEPE